MFVSLFYFCSLEILETPKSTKMVSEIAVHFCNVGHKAPIQVFSRRDGGLYVELTHTLARSHAALHVVTHRHTHKHVFLSVCHSLTHMLHLFSHSTLGGCSFFSLHLSSDTRALIYQRGVDQNSGVRRNSRQVGYLLSHPDFDFELR